MIDPVVRKYALRAMLTLPTPILRALSGGGVTYLGGRTLDPRMQFIAGQARGRPPLTSATPVEARRLNAAGLASLAGRLDPEVRVEFLTVPGADGPVGARAYRPKRQNPRAPLLVYAHFGGGVIGDLNTSEAFCGIMAKVAGCPVLSVDYRLAPEHRFPAGLNDMLAAYRWARDQGPRFGAPLGAVAVGGDSIGGNFAAVISQEMQRADEPQPVFQLLIYPAVDAADESPSMTTYAQAFPLTRDVMAWFMGHYLRTEDSPADPRLSPGRSGRLSGLAPAVVATAGFDALLDQGEAYARSLRAAGVPTSYRCYDSLSHGFTAFTGAVPAADAACRDIAIRVRTVIEGGA